MMMSSRPVKRAHEPSRVVDDLLSAEIAEKQARSIKYQIAIAKLPFATEIDDFTLHCTAIPPAPRARARPCQNLPVGSRRTRGPSSRVRAMSRPQRAEDCARERASAALRIIARPSATSTSITASSRGTKRQLEGAAYKCSTPSVHVRTPRHLRDVRAGLVGQRHEPLVLPSADYDRRRRRPVITSTRR